MSGARTPRKMTTPRWSKRREPLQTALLRAVIAAVALVCLADRAGAAAVTWTGAGEIGPTRNWTVNDNWSPAGVPGAFDMDTFGVIGDGVIHLVAPRSAQQLIFQDFTTTTLQESGTATTLTIGATGGGWIRAGEGVRQTYGCDYFTAGRKIADNVSLNDSLFIQMGAENDSSLMFSGSISATSPNFGIELDNLASSSGKYQGNSLWITSANTFAGPIYVRSWSNNVRWGTAIKLADAGRMDTAPIKLEGALAALSLLTSATYAAAPYNNTITIASGGGSFPIIHADRSYQQSDMANDTNVTVHINDVVLDNSDPNADTVVGFGSANPYLRTHNGYIIVGKGLVLGTSNANAKTVYVNNGNFTAGRAGNRYLGGVNQMNISMNEVRFTGNAGVGGLVDHGQDLNKWGPGILEIGGDNLTPLPTPSTGTKYIYDGVLRFASANSIGMGPIVLKLDGTGVGVGWDGLPPLITNNIPGLQPVGASGALDIDVANFTTPLSFATDPKIMKLRLGSSSRTGGSVSGPVTPNPAAIGGLWFMLGGGGGTLTINSNLSNFQGGRASLEMGTTGRLLPGRVVLAPTSGWNDYWGDTMIYAGTLQPAPLPQAVPVGMFSVNTTCQNFDGSYYNTAGKMSLSGNTFSFEGPGQLLLDPAVAYNFPVNNPKLDGGAVGWTANKQISSITADVGFYQSPINSVLWWSEDTGVLESARPTFLLHLGGEYSQGTMSMAATCPITDSVNMLVPVALVKSGIYSTLDLSTGPAAGNTYTGGTAIIGGELRVTKSNQVNGDPSNLAGGPILIANGGTLHVAATSTVPTTVTFTNGLKFMTQNTPDTMLNPGNLRSTLFNGSVIEVDDKVTAKFTGLLDGLASAGSRKIYASISPVEKTGKGTLYFDYTVGGVSVQYPYAGTDANHWGLKLTDGLVSTNQLPYVVTGSNGVGERSNGFLVCNGGDLEVRNPPPGADFHQDADYTKIPGSLGAWVYGFFGFNSFQGTSSTIRVQDDGMFRVNAMSPNIIMGTVIFEADHNRDVTAPNDANNIFHLRMASDQNHNPDDWAPPGGDSRGTGTLELRGGTVILTSRDNKRVLPGETGFTLKLNGGVFNGMPEANLNGNLIINDSTVPGAPKIDGEFSPPDWQAGLNMTIWTIAGTGATSWRGTLEKIGPGKVVINRELGAPVAVATGATFKISGGKVDVGGTGDPFADTSSPGQFVSIINDSPAFLNFTTGSKHIGALSGTGTTIVNGSLTADSIVQGTLIILSGSTVTIRESTGSSVSAVPEPGTWVLIGAALLSLTGWLALRRR